MKTKKVKIVLVKGVEGNSIYINDYRVCGNKPWGGGDVIETWVTSKEYIKEALRQKMSLPKTIKKKMEEL